jgi:type VI secretion system protein ImpC
MSAIFISYRREDSFGYARVLYDRIRARFGEQQVFMDVDAISPGEDFVEVLEQKVETCKVFIAVIGRQWLTVTGVDGRRRLDNPEDFVRLEIAAAINRRLPIIPMLVGGATMPRSEDMPEPLKTLTRRQAVEISDIRFDRDMNLLIEILEKTVSPLRDVQSAETEKGKTDLDAPPDRHVSMSYEVQVAVGGAIERRQIPFVIGVLADLAGAPALALPRLRDRQFVEINQENFDAVLKALEPRLQLSLKNRPGTEGERLKIELQFRALADFEPEAVAGQVPSLSRLRESYHIMTDLLTNLNDRIRGLLQQFIQSAVPVQAAERDRQESPSRAHDLLEHLIEAHYVGQDDGEKGKAKLWLVEFLTLTLSGEITVSQDIESMLSAYIGAAHEKLSAELNEIIHAPGFQQLEATWRGLRDLVSHTGSSPLLKIKVLDVSKVDLRRDLEKAVEVEQSALFKKVHEEEYGTLGGEPFAALIGDYYFGRHPQDIVTLEKLSNVAAAAGAPFVAGIDTTMFGFQDISELALVRDLSQRFKAYTYANWQSFRESEDSRYVGLVMPRVRLRMPYRQNSTRQGGFQFEETSGDTEHHQFLWGNSAYLVAAHFMNAFNLSRWCGAMHDQKIMLMQHLSLHPFAKADGMGLVNCHTELAISPRRQAELAMLGFIAIGSKEEGEPATLVDLPSCQRATHFHTDEDNIRAWLSTQLESSLAVSRVVHYLKAIVRYKGSGFLSPQHCQEALSEWISQYLDTGRLEKRTATPRPFHEARFHVTATLHGYKVAVTLQPQFELDHLPEFLKVKDFTARLTPTHDITIFLRDYEE